jgi:outer membrane immunogenic protein
VNRIATLTTAIAIVALPVLLAASIPASAQTAAAPSGPRVEALVGYDALRVDLQDFGVDEKLKDNDLFYGIGAGYDFPVGTGLSAGIDVEATDSNNKADFDDGEENAEIRTGRDLYAGGRITMPIASGINVYAKAGYTNLKIKGEASGIDDSVNLDGVRLGAGTQFELGRNAYVGGEYRFSNYENDVTRHQVAAKVGLRF